METSRDLPADEPAETVAPTGAARRVSASIVDQVISTGTNVVITLSAAQLLGASSFGAFSTAYLVAVATIGCSRAAIGSPALVFQPDALRDGGREPFGASLACGMATAAVVAAAAALLTDGALRGALLVVAASLPGLLVQDAARLVEFAAQRPGGALVLDVCWAVLIIAGFGAMALADVDPSAAVLLGLWGAAGTGSAVVAIARNRRLAAPSLAWLRRTWGFGWRYLAVYVSTLGALQIAIVALGGISGVAAVGAVAAVQILFGPLQNLATGLMVVFVPAVGPGTPLRGQRPRVVAGSLMLAALAALIGVVAALVPDEVGEAVLGASWDGARRLILPATLNAVMFGLTSGPVIGLRAARAVQESLSVGVRMAGFQVTVPLIGAVLGDEQGFMWGLVATWVAGCTIWWRCYLSVESGRLRPAAA